MVEYEESLKNEVLISRKGDRFHYFLKDNGNELEFKTIRHVGIRFGKSSKINISIQYRNKDGKLFAMDEINNLYDVMVLGVQEDDK